MVMMTMKIFVIKKKSVAKLVRLVCTMYLFYLDEKHCLSRPSRGGSFQPIDISTIEFACFSVYYYYDIGCKCERRHLLSAL